MNGNHARKLSYRTHDGEAPKKKHVKVKVRRRGWVTKGEKLLYSLLGVVTIMASAYVISYSSKTDEINRDVQNLEKSVINQQIINEGLSFEVSELSDPARITKIARENGLKVQYAEVKRVESLNDD